MTGTANSEAERFVAVGTSRRHGTRQGSVHGGHALDAVEGLDLPSGAVPASEALMVLAHRTVGRDTFPNGWARTGENNYSVTAVLPRDHPFFAPASPMRHDPLLIVEAMRQATMLIIHAGLDVPLECHLLLTDLDFDCRPQNPVEGAGPVDVVLDITCSEIKRRGSRLAEMRSDVVLSCHGQDIATGVGRVICLPPQVYRRLRGDRLNERAPRPLCAPVTCQEAGCKDIADVVLSATERELVWQLRVDTTHETLFQRPNDHVPGMLLLEAARQAAHAATDPVPFIPSAGAVSFRRYAEFGSPCWISARVYRATTTGAVGVHVTGTQDDEVVFVCDLQAAGS